MANELGHNKNNEKNYSKMFFPQKAMLKERNLSRSFFKSYLKIFIYFDGNKTRACFIKFFFNASASSKL